MSGNGPDRETTRLQKVLARAGLGSRRQMEAWIGAGRVRVNGVPAELGQQVDPARDRIEVDGRPLQGAEEKLTVLLNKPCGYVTTSSDPQGRPVVLDLLAELPVRLFPVGRLDFNTEGLLLLTNDGPLAHRLMHPAHEVEKTYLVRIRGRMSGKDLRRLETGVELEDGLTAPARVRQGRSGQSHSWLELTIHEGRNRQVRRMCEALGYPVSRLRRIRLDGLELGDLPPGAFRPLTRAELLQLKKTVGLA